MWRYKLRILENVIIDVVMILYGNEVGTVLEKVITFLPKFEIYKNNEYIGCLSKELSFFTGRVRTLVTLVMRWMTYVTGLIMSI